MRELLHGLAASVHRAISAVPGHQHSRYANRRSPGGDAQFGIDEVAERAVTDHLAACGVAVALRTEDAELRVFGRDPQVLLVVDPIDGTRPAAAGFEMATISIAAAPFHAGAEPTLGDVRWALLQEIATGRTLYADRERPGIEAQGYPYPVPALAATRRLEEMFWSLELNGHPAALMAAAYGHLIDRSANTGGVFLWNSATYSISRLLTGQMDAYVDVGNRLLRDHPHLAADFRRVGGGHVLHLFPYDIAAAVLLAEKGGVTITDAYGRSLASTPLLSTDDDAQQSCLAAATPELHALLLAEIDWRAPGRGEGLRVGADPGVRRGG